jgi:hypothetical protein
MDSSFFSAAIVWGALGFALACVILRLRAPRRPHPLGGADLPLTDSTLPEAERLGLGPAEALVPRAAAGR